MRRLRSLALAALTLVLLAGAGCAGESDDQLHIRIRNASPLDIDGFWLGTGSGAGGPSSRAYGEIAAGETTRYRTRKAQFGYYSNFNLVTADGQRFLGVFPREQVGTIDLEPGYYTFVFRVEAGRGLLEVVRDAAPD